MPNHAAAMRLTAELARAPPEGSPQAVPLPGSETPGRSPIYRHWRFADKPLLTTMDPDVRTLHDLFQSSADTFPRNRCLGERKWLPAKQAWDDKFSFLTYAEVAERRKNFGAGLVEVQQKLGLPKDAKGIALWSQNRPEWQIVDLGCASQGLYTVSLYETLGPDATEFILNHAELTSVATSITHIPALIKLAPRLPLLKLIVCLDDLDAGEVESTTKGAVLRQFAADSGIHICSLKEVEQIGKDSGRPMNPAHPEDIYTINYTSGTTGMPKGVVLTHAACVASNCGTRIGAGEGSTNDVALSYMPLAHMLQRLVEHGGFAVGAAFGYFRGDLTGLLDDIKVLKPTGFISVPRLFNRFNSALRQATIEADGFKGNLSKQAIASKLANMSLPMGQAYHSHWLYDRFWTPKVRAALGFQRIKVMGSGSAPLDPQVQRFLTAAIGARLVQGYGLTESAGVVSTQLVGDYSTGNCGPPSPNVEVCLESVPDMGYDVHDKPNPRGELLLRGPSIFTGYLKNEEENKKAIDADGWFHTGDVALIDEVGRIRIIDRKKNIVKLAQGEYVAPERIENVYSANCNLIAMAYVHGDSTESTLVGVFGVNPETFAPWASKLLGSPVAESDVAALEAAAKHPTVKTELLKIFDKIGTKAKFNGYEKIKNLLLAVEPFTVENELLTPTLKLKRVHAGRAFKDEIAQMYAEIAAKTPARTKL